ncbi:MAG: hypothetical protein DBY16_10450 [Coprobacter sp.]|nr:MAG: hypothetical protein DBY16_10450 [Coprobacter sp.]
MNLFLIIDSIKSHVQRRYRKYIFLQRTRTPHKAVTLLGNVYLNASNVKIGRNVTIYPNVSFEGVGEIIIGDNVSIGFGCIIHSDQRVYIGSDTSIAAYTYIIDVNHGISRKELIRKQNLETSSIYIGSDVWIAAHCTIIKGAEIQDGAVVGAMSMVNKEIGPYCIAYGIPAKNFGERK